MKFSDVPVDAMCVQDEKLNGNEKHKPSTRRTIYMRLAGDTSSTGFVPARRIGVVQCSGDDPIKLEFIGTMQYNTVMFHATPVRLINNSVDSIEKEFRP